MAERPRGFWARDYGENVPVFGQFHQKCGDKVVLTERRTVASGRTGSLLDPFPSPPDPKRSSVFCEGFAGRQRVGESSHALCGVCPAWIAHTRQ